MAIAAGYETVEDVIAAIGDAGQRLREINATEGGAGNLSVFVAGPVALPGDYTQVETIALPVAAPHLAHGMLVVTGSGRRLRDLACHPETNLGCLVVAEDGLSGRLCTSPGRRFARLTSEFNSHLAVHDEQVGRTGARFHAIVHAQPPYLTFLSHIDAYCAPDVVGRALLRWQPEMIMNFPEGIGCLPFELPGSAGLMQANVAALARQRLVVWCKHGVMARADDSVEHAVDLVEYAEASARYEYLNLTAGEPAEGLNGDQMAAICKAYGVKQELF